MGFDGVFRKVFGRKGLGGTLAGPEARGNADAPMLHPSMVGELSRLDLYVQGLGKTAMRHVLTGDPMGFAQNLAAIVAKVPRWQSAYHKDNAAINDAQGKVDVALAKGEIAGSPATARFFALRHIVRPMASQPGYGQQPYPEAQMLMREVFSAFLQGESRLNSHSYTIQPPPPVIRTLSPLQVLELIRHTGGDETDYFELAGPHANARRGEFQAEFAQLANRFPAEFAAALKRARNDSQLMAMVKLVEEIGLLAHLPVLDIITGLIGKGNSAAIRETTISMLARLDHQALLNLLHRTLATSDIETRYGLVQAAGRNGATEVLAVLADRGKIEKAAKVKAAIDMIVEASGVAESAGPATDGEEPGYAAIDGRFIALPPRKDLGSDDIPLPEAECRAEFGRVVEKIEQRRVESHEAYLARHAGRSANTAPPVPFTFEVIKAAYAGVVQGDRTVSAGNQLARVLRHYDESQAWLRNMMEPLPLRARLKVLEATGHNDIRYVLGLDYVYGKDREFGCALVRDWLEQEWLDLRDIGDDGHLRGLLTRQTSGYDRQGGFAALDALPKSAVWPWLIDNMAVLDEALGLKPAAAPILLERALDALALLPVLPQRYFARVLEIAVAERRPLRKQAIALLRDGRDLVSRIEALLDDKRMQVRSNAATLLADLRAEPSIAAMRKRLKKEKSDPVRAALIIALQRLGADLSDVIGPATLMAEAEAATAKGNAALPEWLSVLPPVRFGDGSTVPLTVVAHWLALAIRLKDPAAHGQFGIYLDQLDPADARALSNWVLESWIAYDTKTSTLDEATAWAQANYQTSYNWMYNGRQTPELRDQVIARLIRDKQGELLNSGSDFKGMLALACRADPVWASGRVRWFLKKHGRRSNQAMALLETLAGTGAPAALQVVIAASTRLKQKSTQARAAEIAQRYAEDRGWSVDELADRTVPTAGFDDDGELELPCGEDGRLYLARLDAQLAIHLFNPDGKPVRGLPAGDDEATKESKKAWSAAKKELAQVIELQAGRLFEAMCLERSWAVDDWLLAFHQHPVMRRLVERLVWQGLDAEGTPQGLLRPTQEGDFTDADDNAVDLQQFARLRLAHGALVDEATCKAWIAHLKDYEINPFIAQFDTLRAPLSGEQAEAEAIFDRQGWRAESLTFRGVAEKRGYARVMRDGGGCNEYVKEFPGQGITATIFHTGSYAVDENNPVALKELRFARAGQRGAWRLKDVPPVLLAECWADYHAVAAKGAFDAEWEKISPW